MSFRTPPSLVALALICATGFQAMAQIPQWIWSKESSANQTLYLRKQFTGVTPRVSAARLYASCDNGMVVYINGKKVMSSQSWDQPQYAEVLSHLDVKKPNVISVKATNADGIAGLLVKLVLDSDRAPVNIVSDKSWKISSKPEEEWQTPDFNDSRWSNAVSSHALGEGPWARAVNAKSLQAKSQLRKPVSTPVEQMKIKDGFKVELIYDVPKAKQGSWVAMTTDHKGRLIASDQYGHLYRVTLPPLKKTAPVKVEKIDIDMGHAQGLLWAFDSLYVVVNDKAHGGRGLYRLTDSNNDDVLDTKKLLKKFQESGGEHGPHAVVLGPEGKSLYIVVGNQTALPEYSKTRVPPVWGEDLLLPRVYGRGFMKGAMAPRGWVAKTDPEGKNWEIIATGFRNQYDAAFNRHGDLFTYDADMEWDINTPWYRPTRVCQVVSGGEFGWRNGSGKWPSYFPDTVPPTLNIGPGSPTGVVFGYGAAFPTKYQNAFFINDWSYGKLYAVHLKEKGASYDAEFEEFITGQPLPLTDIVVNPKDKAMYFAIGGRRVQSALYRVTYDGPESTSPAKTSNKPTRIAQLRRSLEAYHGNQDTKAVNAAWPYLSHQDRFIRYAARVAIEHQPATEWAERALKENNTEAALQALVALARVGDKSLQPRILNALERIKWAGLPRLQRLALVRAYALTFIRMGEPSDSVKAQVASRFDPVYPAESWDLNIQLSELMTYLQSPRAASKGVALLKLAPTQEEQIALAKNIRLLKAGWTSQLREDYFKWFHKAAGYRGGAAFGNFIASIKKDAVAQLSAAEKKALQPILDYTPEKVDPIKASALQSEIASRGFYKNWTVDELASGAEDALKKGGRNFNRGRSMFGTVACFQCHRFDGQGGAIGPDLTGAAGRFSARDLLESIIEPSKEISDQYGSIVITLNDDTEINGRIANLSGDGVRLITDMFDPGAMMTVDRKLIKSIEPSKTSMMPPGLVNLLKKDEIYDLLAYVLSRGDKTHRMFE